MNKGKLVEVKRKLWTDHRNESFVRMTLVYENMQVVKDVRLDRTSNRTL